MNSDIILVRKASGAEEPFSVEKLENSLRNAGADAGKIEEIVSDIRSWIYPGVTTKKIYARAFEMLHREKNAVALRYKLKQAILELGPTGYVFEKLVGLIMEKMGFEVQVGQIIEGACITHEVDVIATAAGKQYFVECKYAHDQGKTVNIQVPLYVHSRVHDIINKRKSIPEYRGFTFMGWVVTNTGFSPDCIEYSRCSGLNLLGWDHPQGSGLKYLIEREKIFPITVLSHLTSKNKEDLLEQGIITCTQLRENIGLLSFLGLTQKKSAALHNELDDLLSAGIGE
jgi:hypothetical protein